jgi:excisionase family DNA binding protein
MDMLLLKVPDVAQQLGVSRAKVYELMSRGLLPSVKVDGCRRIRSEDLRAFTANLETSWPRRAPETARGGT